MLSSVTLMLALSGQFGVVVAAAAAVVVDSSCYYTSYRNQSGVAGDFGCDVCVDCSAVVAAAALMVTAVAQTVPVGHYHRRRWSYQM